MGSEVKNGISIEDEWGKDILVNFDFEDFCTDNNTFWTDSNGLEMQKRVLDQRPTWDINLTQHVAGNYYPVGSAVAIRCNEKSFPQ